MKLTNKIKMKPQSLVLALSMTALTGNARAARANMMLPKVAGHSMFAKRSKMFKANKRKGL